MTTTVGISGDYQQCLRCGAWKPVGVPHDCPADTILTGEIISAPESPRVSIIIDVAAIMAAAKGSEITATSYLKNVVKILGIDGVAS